MNDDQLEDDDVSLFDLAIQHLWRHLQYTKIDVNSPFNSTTTTMTSIYNNNNDHDDSNDFERFASFDSSSSSSSSSGGGGGGHGRDAYEFVAFLLWYLFLVLCCVIPTCCAYRRRRLVEARIAQQQASVNRIERQNLFILSSLRQSQQNTERIREQRSSKITEKLKDTTMTVEEHNIVDISGEENDYIPPRNTVMIVSDEPPPGADANNGDNSTPPPAVPGAQTSNLAIEYDIEAADPESTYALQIKVATQEGNNTITRTVPGACAICLCPYEVGDQVTWSPKEACQHAFHSECIIPWLAKSDEPKCPCCRQDFCDPVPISQLDTGTVVVDPISIFGPPTMTSSPHFAAGTATAAGLALATDGDGVDDDLVIPHFMRTLEASRLEFLASLELAAVEASGRTPTAMTTPATAVVALPNMDAAATTNNNNIDINGEERGGTATTSPLDDGSPFEGASEEAQVSGSGNNTNDDEEHDYSSPLPFDEEIPATATAAPAAPATIATASVDDAADRVQEEEGNLQHNSQVATTTQPP